MKAVFFKEHGGTDVLRYGDVEQPRIGPTDVLFRIKAAGMNRNDL